MVCFLSDLLQEYAIEHMEIVSDPARLSPECYRSMQRAKDNGMSPATMTQQDCRYRRRHHGSSMSRWDCAAEAERLPAALMKARLYERSDSFQYAVDLVAAVLASTSSAPVPLSSPTPFLSDFASIPPPTAGLQRQSSADTQPQRPLRRASIDRTPRQCNWAQSA